MHPSIFESDYQGPPALVVELSGNHNSSLSQALSLARAAKHGGADYLKLQCYKADTITINCSSDDFKVDQNSPWFADNSLYSLYESAHTPWDWIEEIFKLCRDIDLPVFASPFDNTSVDFLESLDCPIYKIASPEIVDIGLIEKCAQTGKPVILSTGLASENELSEALSAIQKYHNQIIILKCVSAYPTPIEDINVSTIPWLRTHFGCSVGLSDHTLGSVAAMSATALGAVMVEKHFKLDNDTSSVDQAFSMKIGDLPTFKKNLLDTYKSVGSPTLEIPDVAKSSISGKRSLYVVRDIKAGQLFTHDNVKSIRPGFGLHPRHLNDIVGTEAMRDFCAGDRITAELLPDAN